MCVYASAVSFYFVVNCSVHSWFCSFRSLSILYIETSVKSFSSPAPIACWLFIYISECFVHENNALVYCQCQVCSWRELSLRKAHSWRNPFKLVAQHMACMLHPSIAPCQYTLPNKNIDISCIFNHFWLTLCCVFAFSPHCNCWHTLLEPIFIWLLFQMNRQKMEHKSQNDNMTKAVV